MKKRQTLSKIRISVGDLIPRTGNSNKFSLKQKSPANYNLQGFVLWGYMDSNQGPSACKADALNQLSYTPG